MAKMFYTLEEAAERLEVSEDEVRQMVSDGKLQQFRDRDKLMFKREQVDTLSGRSKGESSGEGDSVSLDDTSAGDESSKEDDREATGISVFDADEVDEADPMAQTQVTSASTDDDELVLESVGSGSGLLDLTRESDDTSLGAELLEEIIPGGGEDSDAGLETTPMSSNVFDTAPDVEPSASGLENLQSGDEAIGGAPVVVAAQEPSDPIGSGFSAGMLFGALVALFLGLIMAMYAVFGTPSALTTAFAQSLPMYAGLLLIGSILLGIVGAVVGKVTA